MRVFKFRAECLSDACWALMLISARRVEIDGCDGTPDVVVTLTGAAVSGSELDLDALRDILAGVIDGHVMVHTLAPAENYTGVR